MTRHAISLGRIAGIDIRLDYSWFLIFLLLSWMLAGSYYPAELKGGSPAEYWVMGMVTAALLFVSVLLHELGHSLVARRYQVGVRSITLFIFGGVSDIKTEPPSAVAEFWIAIAGPITSFVLAGLFALLQPVVGALAPLAAVVKYLAFINGMLGVFNLVPGFPLDGGRVFRAILRGVTHDLRRATVIAGNVGRLIAFLFIALGVWQVLRGDVVNGLWIAFIGWFLESAAVTQIQQQAIRGSLAGHPVSEAMTRDYSEIPGGATLQQLVDEHVLGRGQRSFIVKAGDEVAGLLTLRRVKDMPRAGWPTTTARQAMIPIAQAKRVRPDAELWATLQAMDQDGVNQLPVMADGRMLGMLTRESIISYLRTRQELGV
jgi:Zn-dependent protease